jgi:ABC-type Co2+ transport system permease subunit
MSTHYALDGREVLVRILKYILEGIVVAFAAYFLPGKNKMDVTEILLIGLVAAATFAVLDLFAPSIGASARSGAGLGVGLNLVGFPGGAPNVKGMM